jgi:hypothetical protein
VDDLAPIWQLAIISFVDECIGNLASKREISPGSMGVLGTDRLRERLMSGLPVIHEARTYNVDSMRLPCENDGLGGRSLSAATTQPVLRSQAAYPQGKLSLSCSSRLVFSAGGCKRQDSIGAAPRDEAQ